MSPEVAALIAEGVVAAIHAAEGELTKQDVLRIIDVALKTAARAEMLREFPNEGR